MSPTAPLHVIIIGGGPTGLLMAHGLQQAGIAVSVYEREDAKRYLTRPREWSMSVHWGTEYLNLLIPEHMREGLHPAVSCDPSFKGPHTGLPVYNMQSGEHLLTIPVDIGDGYLRVSRTKLRKYLSQGIDIHYGKELSSLHRDESTGQMTAEFHDGTKATGSLVIGCDGGRSSTRDMLLGKEAAAPKTMDYNMCNIVLKFPADVAIRLRQAEPVFRVSYHPSNFMWLLSVQNIQDVNKPEDWLFHTFMSWPGAPGIEELPDAASRVRFWKEKARDSAEPYRTVAEHIPDDFNIPLEKVTYWAPEADWSQTSLGHRVTLAGDAAHPIPPYRGQGLNLGMQDAANLVLQLKAVQEGTKSLDDAVVAYETEMRERACLEVNITKAQTEMCHNYAVLMDAPMMKLGMIKAKELKQAQDNQAQAALKNQDQTMRVEVPSV